MMSVPDVLLWVASVLSAGLLGVYAYYHIDFSASLGFFFWSFFLLFFVGPAFVSEHEKEVEHVGE